MDKRDQFIELCNIYGPSSNEKEVAEWIIKKIPSNFNIKRDNLGSIIASSHPLESNLKKVMIISHMDEIGFMISGFNSDGTLTFEGVGGINYSNLLSQTVCIKNNRGEKFYGMFALNCYSMRERSSKLKNSLSNTDYVLDFGFINKDEAEQKISFGDIAIFSSQGMKIDNNRVIAKAIDDRAGCFTILESMKDLKIRGDINYVYCFSVQEEVGCRGAITLSNMIKPDLAIVTDISYAFLQMGHVGKGPLFRPMDAGTMQKPIINNYIKEVYNKLNVSYQNYISFGATDGSKVHTSNIGVPTMQLCLIGKEIHSANGIVSMDDINSLSLVIKNVLETISVDQISKFKEEI